MKDGVVRVGLIGCGGISCAHVGGFLKIPDRARVVALADVVRANAEARAAELGEDP